MNTSKSCSKCKLIKPFTEFSPDKRTTAGYQSVCKKCYAEHRRIKHAKNPEHFRKLVAESTKRNYQKKLQRNQEYRKNNADKVAAWKAKDRLLNKDRVAADNAKRRHKFNGNRTSETRIFYALRDFYSSMSLGEIFHVDHIIPLSKGGSHHSSNLQVIPAIDNLRKGNAVPCQRN
jgi:5-methylcytosine-specific restriction endonuclease McrA